MMSIEGDTSVPKGVGSSTMLHINTNKHMQRSYIIPEKVGAQPSLDSLKNNLIFLTLHSLS